MSDHQPPIPGAILPPMTPAPRAPAAPWWVTARRVLAVATGVVGVLSALVELLERLGVIGSP